MKSLFSVLLIAICFAFPCFLYGKTVQVDVGNMSEEQVAELQLQAARMKTQEPLEQRILQGATVCKAIVLNQYNITYRFINNRYLKLQGCKYRFRIQGLDQIPKSAEITCATLCHRHNDYYLKVTCYLPKEEINYSDYSVGIDFGISTTLTLTKGGKIRSSVPRT